MEQVKLFLKKGLEKICFCLFTLFFTATYPWYKKAKYEMDNISDDEIFREKLFELILLVFVLLFGYPFYKKSLKEIWELIIEHIKNKEKY